MIRSAYGSSACRAASADSCSSRSPLVATMTGSRTTTPGRVFSSQVRTASITEASPSIPILTASMVMSWLMASSWAVRKAAGGTCTALTPRVFCAVRAVMAAMP